MATIVNGVNCAIELKGTGLPECIQELSDPVGFFKTSVNWKFDALTETFNLAYIQLQIQNGNFVPFLKSFNFTDNSAETVFQESQTGNKSRVRGGKPEVMFEFQKGICWHSSAYSHITSNCGIIYIWDNAVFGFRESSTAGELKSHRANYLDVGTFKNNDGANNLTTPLSIQFRNVDEYNANMATVKADGFDLDDIKGVMDVAIGIPTPPTPTATTIDVTVTSTCNTTLSIGVLSPTDFAITGKTINKAVYNPSTETYTITIAETFVLGDEYNVSLMNGLYNVVIVEDQPYKGKSATLIVA